MAQLTTEQEILSLPLGTQLHVINPFERGYKIQHKIEIQTITIDRIELLDNNYVIYSMINNCPDKIDKYRLQRSFISDLLSSCKFVFHDLQGAQSKLLEVHEGLCINEVKHHHGGCKEDYQNLGYFN